MLNQLLVRSILFIISTTCTAQAYIVPGQPADLPAYHENQTGDINEPPDNQTNSDPNPYEPGHPGAEYSREIKSIYIGRSVRNERLPLREMAGLDRSYNGSEIISIQARTQPDSSSRTVVQLVADGRIVAEQINPGYQINLRPYQHLVLGSNVRSLQLIINGSTIIQEIQIEILRGGNGQPYPGPNPGPITPPPHNPPGYGDQRLDINMERITYGNDRIDLNQYINLNQYRGMTITQIIVTATPQYQSAFIDLLINSFNQGQLLFNGPYRQQQSVWLQNNLVIGQGADSIVLYTRGNMIVHRVTLLLRY